MLYKRVFYILLLCLFCSGVQAKQSYHQPSKGLLFFYRSSDWADKFLMKNIDTAYIALPEHSWRIAYTNAIVGINSTIQSDVEYGSFSLLNKTSPSLDLGFHLSYRGIGFGYSWDAIHAYARRLNFSFGSKMVGVDFSLQHSTNIRTSLAYDQKLVGEFSGTVVHITNANLSLWYALNYAHYSHNAAIKQPYIQRKTAGSLLLHLSYMSSKVSLVDTLNFEGVETPLLALFMSNVTDIQTRQIAVGLGYGINYTPNKGKVLLHASAAAMLVTYSINHISYYVPDSIAKELPGSPMYELKPSFPVHLTGNVRAAVSWEINKWVHLSAWATGDNIRFRSAQTASKSSIFLSSWQWKIQFTVGVRLGAGQDRVQKALAHYRKQQEQLLPEQTELTQDSVQQVPSGKRQLPQWITDYFYSPKKQ